MENWLSVASLSTWTEVSKAGPEHRSMVKAPLGFSYPLLLHGAMGSKTHF